MYVRHNWKLPERCIVKTAYSFCYSQHRLQDWKAQEGQRRYMACTEKGNWETSWYGNVLGIPWNNAKAREGPISIEFSVMVTMLDLCVGNQWMIQWNPITHPPLQILLLITMSWKGYCRAGKKVQKRVAKMRKEFEHLSYDTEESGAIPLVFLKSTEEVMI